MIQNLTRQALAVALADEAAAGDVAAHLNAAIPYGNIYYVLSSTGRDGSGAGLTTALPFATIDFAIGRCSANNGDRIYVLPGHAETLTGAGAITADIAGISIIGLGNANLRPTLTLSTVATTIAVSAANVLFKNLRITSSVDELVKVFNVTAAGLTLDGVDVFETTSCQIIQFMLTTAAADNLTIRNCRHVQRTAAAATQIWIQLVGVNDAAIVDNVFLLTLKNETASYTIGGTTACVDAVVMRNTICQAGGNTQDKCVNFATTSTGVLADNRAFTGTGVAITTAFVGDAMGIFDNKWHDSASASGLLTPAVDTDT